MFIQDLPPLTSQEVEIRESYYDDLEIESEMEFVKPLDKIKITSGYGKRTYTIDGKKVTDFHHGVDLVGGTKIYATADGQVVKVVNKGSKGGTMCLVRIKHANGWESAYYHIKSGSARVKKGDWVKAGQWIATIGNTGKVTGTHLHFQIDKGGNDTSINPTKYAKGQKELKGQRKPASAWEQGDYRVLKEKYVRTSGEVKSSNKVKYDKLLPGEKEKCVKDKLGNAKYAVDSELFLNKFTTDKKGNVWGRHLTHWLCVSDNTGYQVEKLDGTI